MKGKATRRIFAALRRRSRESRYQQMRELIQIESREGLIVDLGGGPASFFAAMFPRPQQVVLVDVDHTKVSQARQKQPALLTIVADGRHLPLTDRSVDVTVCNSVIEHLDDPHMLAAEIRRVSRSYFLQTPNEGFPLELHSFIPIPFYNLMPWTWLRQLACKVFGANFEYVNSVHYLTERELKALFPEALIAYERTLGLEKSYYTYYSVAENSESAMDGPDWKRKKRPPAGQ